MRTIKMLLVCIYVALCVSCNSSSKVAIIDSIRQNELNRVDVINFGDERYFSNCFAVKLETVEESLIHQISQMEISDNKIYILDIKKSQVMVFDLTGKYMYSIGKKGAGPEEYLHISAFYIDGEYVNLFDPSNKAVVQYKTSGEFHQKIKYENPNIGFIKKAIPISKDELFAYSASNWEDNSIFSIIDRNNYNTIKNIDYYPGNPQNFISYFYSRQPFSRYDNKITFGMLFSDTLSVCLGQNVTPRLVIKNKENIPDALLKNKLKDADYDYSSVIREINKEDKYNTGILNIFENGKFLLFDFKSGTCMMAILYDKLSNKGVLIENYCHYSPDFGEYFTSNGNTVVRIWNNDEISAFRNEIEKNEEKRNQYPEYILETVRKHNTEDDNPILIFYEFKNQDTKNQIK